MKIFFLKEHSLYKIFKTLEKVPEWKSIHVYIDPEHSFFENEWWWKQIRELLYKRKIKASFITKNEKSKKFFQSLDLHVIHQEKKKRLKALKAMYLFVFNIKKFHLYVYTKKNIIFYLVFVFEVLFFLGIIYVLYTLILPSVKVEIIPSHQIENIIYNFRYYPVNNIDYPYNSRYLSIPYFTGHLEYKYDMSINSSHLRHLQNPSEWQIRVLNFTNDEYSLKPKTRFVTSDGLMFRTKNWLKLPAGFEDIPWEVVVSVEAMERDERGIFMWARWNIEKWKIMYIKNLKESYYLKDIYAKAIDDFTGWILESEWLVTEEDISLLSGKLLDHIYKQKKNIVLHNFGLDDSILLSFNDLIFTNVVSMIIHTQVWESTPNVKWSIVVRYNFMYIKLDDIVSVVEKYLDQRPSDMLDLVTIDTTSLTFFDYKEQEDDIYVISTKTDVVQNYDFKHDINGIVEEIKDAILWKTSDEARKTILSYPEVSSVRVKIKPIRYMQIPKVKSRIKIEMDE